ncbi:MAG: potassium channel family protein [Cyanobacteria bacterium J06632_22]
MKHHNTHRKYQQLLIVLGITFVAAPFSRRGLGNIVLIALLFYSLVVIVKNLSLPRRVLTIYGAIAILTFVLEILANIVWLPEFNRTMSLVSQAVFALYLSGAAYWIGIDIFTTSRVTLDTVRGGISIYMLIGFVWALLYGIINTLDANAFSQPLLQRDSYLRAIHFSFTTLTTVGYGDIVPLSEVAQVLTNLEAIVGQMYSTVLIAILVGSYLSQRPH